MPWVVRPLEPRDHRAIVAIYNHYIEHTPITFDLEPYTEESRAPWFAQFDGQRWRCLVAEDAGTVIGYASSSQFRSKAAYATSVETSVYLHPQARSRGAGSALYEGLFGVLEGTGAHRAYAAITQPNEASMRLHQRFGFKPCGTFREVGYKFDRYWDVAWLEKDCP